VLDFFEQSDDKKVNPTDRLFRDARSLWLESELDELLSTVGLHTVVSRLK
jgi:hypothetical protein